MFSRNSLPKLDSKIRLIHASPKLNSVDIYANGNLIATNLSFGDLTDYLSISPDEYIIEAFESGTYDNPILKQRIEIIPNQILTISFVLDNNETRLFDIKDSSSIGRKDICFVRFLNYSSNSPLLSLSLINNEVLFNDVEYLETTGYYPLSPGIYSFKVSFSGTNLTNKNISNITLIPGEFQTIYVIGTLNGEPQLGYLLTTDGVD